MNPGPEYTFTAVIEDPSGVRVTVTTTVPSDQVGHDRQLTGDLSEVTQMGASTTARRIGDVFKTHNERCPF